MRRTPSPHWCARRSGRRPNEVEHPRNVYLREDALTNPLATAFDPDRLEKTITAMVDAQSGNQPSPAIAAARATIAECDAKLERYRAALDPGAGSLGRRQLDRSDAG